MRLEMEFQMTNQDKDKSGQQQQGGKTRIARTSRAAATIPARWILIAAEARASPTRTANSTRLTLKGP
jgi:hypothetical protein